MKPQRLFPPHIRSFDAAVTFVVDWAEMMGGDITADLVVIEHDRMLDVDRTRVAFVGTETVLTFSFTVDAGLVASRYQFDLRRSNGVLPLARRLPPRARSHPRQTPSPPHRTRGRTPDPRRAGDARAGRHQGRRHPHQPYELTEPPFSAGGSPEQIRLPLAPTLNLRWGT